MKVVVIILDHCTPKLVVRCLGSVNHEVEQTGRNIVLAEGFRL